MTDNHCQNFTTRVPKLAFRNRLSGKRDDESWSKSSALSASESASQLEQSHDSEPSPELCGVMDRERNPSFPSTIPHDDSSIAQSGPYPRTSSTAYTITPNPSAKDMKRKKRNSLLGRLSLKEPSTSAFEKFAKQQQKQAASKGGRMTAVGLPGISSQKMPPDVPKVNSKWDGLPSPVTEKTEHRNAHRDSVFSVTTRNSGSSSPHMSSQASFSSGDGCRTASSSNLARSKERAQSFHHSPLASHETAPNVHRMSLPPALFPLPPFHVPETELPSVPNTRLPSAHTEHPNRVSYNTQYVKDGTAPLDAGFYNYELSKHNEVDSQSFPTWSGRSDDAAVRTCGPDILPPPMGSRSKGPQHTTDQCLQESGSSIESRDSQLKSILKQKTRDPQPLSYASNASGRTVESATPSAAAARTPVNVRPTISAGVVRPPSGSHQAVDRSRPRTALSDVLPWESDDASWKASSPLLTTGEKPKKRGLLDRIKK